MSPYYVDEEDCCPDCGGEGGYEEFENILDTYWVDCSTCRGTGEVNDDMS